MTSGALRPPVYRMAHPDELPAVLRVLRFANFHNVPSPEMPAFDRG